MVGNEVTVSTSSFYTTGVINTGATKLDNNLENVVRYRGTRFNITAVNLKNPYIKYILELSTMSDTRPYQKTPWF